MANSSIIGSSKNKIIKEFIKDKDIVDAIDSKTIDPKKPEQLVNTHIFNYKQNPNTVNDVMTFLFVLVSIPESYYYSKDVFVEPIVEIWIISHVRHMVVDNVPKVTANRNDYLSQLIDKKLNGRDDFGIGKLKLVSNTEDAYNQDYAFRRMVFKCKSVNDSFCMDE